MTPDPSPPLPGRMTVPPWFGWEAILIVLVLLVVVAVAFFVASATSPDVDGRSEWQAALDARSQLRRDVVAGRDEPSRVESREGRSPAASNVLRSR